jgi:hypothetical protein
MQLLQNENEGSIGITWLTLAYKCALLVACVNGELVEYGNTVSTRIL